MSSKNEIPMTVTISGKRLNEYKDVIKDIPNIEDLFFEFLESYKSNFVQPLH